MMGDIRNIHKAVNLELNKKIDLHTWTHTSSGLVLVKPSQITSTMEMEEVIEFASSSNIDTAPNIDSLIC